MLLKKLSSWLIAPSKKLSESDDVRRARLLSAMLIIFMIISPIGSMTSQIPAERMAVGFLFYAVCIAYFISRTRFYVFAGIFAAISIHVPPYVLLFDLDEFTQFTVVSTLSWMTLPLVLSSVWLPLRIAMSIWLGNLTILLIVFSFYLPQLTFDSFFIAFLQVVIFGMVILFAAKLRNKDQDDLINQTAEMALAKNQAESANKAKSEFLAVMSHELRTPLTSIKGGLSLLIHGVIEDEVKAQEILRLAYNNSERLNLLVNDILDFEKIRSGEMTFVRKPEDINSLIRQAIESNQGYAEEYHVHIEVQYIDHVCQVMVDKHRLQQVLSNLISNAIKYSPQEGTVQISIMCVDRIVRVCVKDHGKGIPKEFENHIFMQFSQADSSDTREKGGTGLGLAIAKEIIESHGGKIGYESLPGDGAMFYFELEER